MAGNTWTTPSIFFSWKCLAKVGMIPPKLVLAVCWVERLSPSKAPSRDTTWEESFKVCSVVYRCSSVYRCVQVCVQVCTGVCTGVYRCEQVFRYTHVCQVQYRCSSVVTRGLDAQYEVSAGRQTRTGGAEETPPGQGGQGHMGVWKDRRTGGGVLGQEDITLEGRVQEALVLGRYS